MTRTPDETLIRVLVHNSAKAVRAKDFKFRLLRHADDIVMFDVPAPVQHRGMVESRELGNCSSTTAPAGLGRST